MNENAILRNMWSMLASNMVSMCVKASLLSAIVLWSHFVVDDKIGIQNLLQHS